MTNKFLLLLVASIVAVMAFTVDLFLTCTPYTDIAEIGSYEEASQLGYRYANKGYAREFLALAVWQPRKATHCYELAYQSYDRAVDLWPNYRGAYRSRANILISLGAYEAALDDFYHILILDENDQFVRLSLAQTYERLGEMETAVSYYKESLELMERSDYWLQFQPNRIEETRTHIERLRRSLE